MINTQGTACDGPKQVGIGLMGYRHRVTLKKRYGLLITQQSEQDSRNTQFMANEGAENKQVLGL